jgi:heme ABC exporter ATP-binding subunit CcmA
MRPAHALEVVGLSKLYGRTVALRVVTLRVGAGQALALLGANGSGKTTLLKIVAGAASASAGTVAVFGRDALSEHRHVRSQVGLLAGESYLYDDLTARENLRFTVTMAARVASDQQILLALQAVRLAQHADDRVRMFSSGMKQRLAVARVQLLQPRVLLLDEPYNSLDAEGADMIDDWIGRITESGGAVVIATHDAERVMAIADLVAHLDRGKLSYAGPVQGYREAHALHVG